MPPPCAIPAPSRRLRHARWCAALLRIGALATLAVLTSRGAGVEFSVSQARAEWMPEMSNLRWNGSQLESLFFVLVESDEPQEDLTVTITGPGAARTAPIAPIQPISPEKAAALRAADDWFATKDDVESQRFASRRTLTQLWLPVTAGEPVRFALRQAGRELSQRELTPSVATPFWFQVRWDQHGEDPWLHEQALFPHGDLMIQRGTAARLEFDLVGTDQDQTATHLTLVTSVEDASTQRAVWQHREPGSAKRGSLTQVDVALPCNDWPPGRFVVTTSFVDANGQSLAQVKRGLSIVSSQPTQSRFGAVYADFKRTAAVEADRPPNPTDVDANTRWGPHADVMVSFDGKSDHLVFSHTNHAYTPFWYIDGLGINWEWTEGHDDELGSLEAPYDQECRYSRVSILESSPARAIVHWRYNTTSSRYDRYFDEWVDEYYTIYPDQTVVRKVMGYFRRHNWHETSEPILQTPPGLHPRAVLADEHFSWRDLAGRTLPMDPLNTWKNWSDRWRDFRAPSSTRTSILQFNLRSGRKFFHAFADLRRVYSLWSQLIEDEHGRREAPAAREIPYGIAYVSTPRQQITQWNSYCLFDLQSALLSARTLPDGRALTPAELEAESNNPMSQTKDMPDDRIESTWAFLLGLADQVDPVAMTHAWVAPAAVAGEGAAAFLGYAPTERAYRFNRPANGSTLTFDFRPADGAAQVNPVFVVTGLTECHAPAVLVDGSAVAAADLRVGFEREPAGTFRLVVFTRLQLNAPSAFTIELR